MGSSHQLVMQSYNGLFGLPTTTGSCSVSMDTHDTTQPVPNTTNTHQRYQRCKNLCLSTFVLYLWMSPQLCTWDNYWSPWRQPTVTITSHKQATWPVEITSSFYHLHVAEVRVHPYNYSWYLDATRWIDEEKDERGKAGLIPQDQVLSATSLEDHQPLDQAEDYNDDIECNSGTQTILADKLTPSPIHRMPASSNSWRNPDVPIRYTFPWKLQHFWR